MKKFSKRMVKIKKDFDNNKSCALKDVVKMVKNGAIAKFDETIEVAINLKLDMRKSEQNVRGIVVLPHGNGKKVRVAVIARDDKAKEAKEAGADIVGVESLLEDIAKGNIAFDKCITTPDLMPTIGKVAKVLGPKGLMPNPKLGTVTTDIKSAVTLCKSGQIEYRAEKVGIVQAGIGKASFTENKILDNIKAFVDVVKKAKPATVKGAYLQKISISSTMGSAIKVDLTSI